jgi:hypothetical protein
VRQEIKMIVVMLDTDQIASHTMNRTVGNGNEEAPIEQEGMVIKCCEMLRSYYFTASFSGRLPRCMQTSVGWPRCTMVSS